MDVRLGRKSPIDDPRTLRLSTYLAAELPPAPPTLDLSSAAPNYPMYQNDRLGDCIVEGTTVVAPNARIGYRAKYQGPVIRLTTADGETLTVTLNHAVLTPGGFILARLLKEGDYLIGSGAPERVARFVDVNFDEAPTTIEKKLSALRLASSHAGVKMRSANHFHGDSQFMDGNIDVVRPLGLLKDKAHPSLRQPDGHQKIGPRSHLEGQLQGFGATLKGRHTGLPATLCLIGSPGEKAALEWRHLGVAKTDRIGHRSGWYASIPNGLRDPLTTNAKIGGNGLNGFAAPETLNGASQSIVGITQAVGGTDRPSLMASEAHPTAKGDPTDPHLAGNLVKAGPGLVKAKRLTKVEILSYRGHVYDLSTDQRWYIANGIVTHNCTCAAAGHMVEIWTGREGRLLMPTDADVVGLYNKVNGGVDDGAVMLDVLKVWSSDGLSGEKPMAYMQVNHNNVDHFKVAMNLFEGLYVGVSLPTSAQSETDAWSATTDEPGSWGGHAISALGYNDAGVVFCTWGRLVTATWPWVAKYVEEAWAVLPSEWTTQPGIDMAALRADLNNLS